MLLSPLKVVISLFFSLPLNLITCSTVPLTRSVLKTQEWWTGCQVYARNICQTLDPNGQIIDLLHRPTQMGVESTTAQPDHQGSPQKCTTHYHDQPSKQLSNSMCTEKDSWVPNSSNRTWGQSFTCSRHRAILATTWGWRAYHSSSSLNSREGTVVFLTRVREHSTGLFSELKPLLSWSDGFPDRLARVRTERTWYELFC